MLKIVSYIFSSSEEDGILNEDEWLRTLKESRIQVFFVQYNYLQYFSKFLLFCCFMNKKFAYIFFYTAKLILADV